jgi:hypothetical protein
MARYNPRKVVPVFDNSVVLSTEAFGLNGGFASLKAANLQRWRCKFESILQR